MRSNRLGGLASFILAGVSLVLGAGRAQGQWEIQTVESEGNVGWGTSIALASDGSPRITYYDRTDECLKYAAWQNNSWEIQTVVPAGIWGAPGAERTSLVLDQNDWPRFAYKDSEGNAWDLKYAAWNGASWDVQTVDNTGGHIGEFCSLRLDSEGRPRISYNKYHVGHQLRYAAWNGTSWDVQIVDSSPGAGIGTALQLGEQDWPYISYRDGRDQNLMLARWIGYAWEIEVVDDSGDVGTDNCMALDASGQPRISYRDEGNEDLKYAAWNGTSWDIETVDASGNVGEYTSLALDAAGNPRISYHKRSVGTLKYAAWNGTSWEIETVGGDPANFLGWDNSLVLDANDYPWISYRNYSRGDLEVAHFVPEPATLLLLAAGLAALIVRKRRT